MKSFATCSLLVFIGCWLSLSGGDAITLNLAKFASADGGLVLTKKFLTHFLLHFNGIPAKTDLKFPEQVRLDISFPILPPLPDPLFLNDTQVVIPIENATLFHGYANGWNSSITGLSKLVDNFSISPTPDYEFLLSYSVQAPEILFRGEHDANLTLTSSGVEILTKGDYSVGFTNAFIGLTLKVKILLENALSITSASLDLSFDELKAHTTEATIAGEPINWDELSEQITVIFPVLWEQAKGNIDMLIRIGLNAVMRDCKLTDLIKGNLDCITGEE